MLRWIVLLAVLCLPLMGCALADRKEVVYVEPDWFYQDAPDESDGAPVATAPTSDP